MGFCFVWLAIKGVPTDECWECLHVILAFGLGMLVHNVLSGNSLTLCKSGEKIQSVLLKQAMSQSASFAVPPSSGN